MSDDPNERLTSEQGPIRLRATTEDDVPYVVAAEAIARGDGYLIGWTVDQHRAALVDPDTACGIVVAVEDGRRVGYLILRGLTSPDRSVELKRIVISEAERGFGGHALRLVKRLAFERFAAHRLWLDVLTDNARARRVYLREGFVPEGVLRDAVALPDGRRGSLEVMSVLATDR